MTRSTRFPNWLVLGGVLLLPLALVPRAAAATTLIIRLTYTQNTAGIAGTVEAGDRLGHALAFRDKRTLVIGHLRAVPIPDRELTRHCGCGADRQPVRRHHWDRRAPRPVRRLTHSVS